MLALEQANATGVAGGRFTLSPVLLGDAVRGIHDPAAGAQNVKTLIADSSVLGMIGPVNSNVAKAEIALTNDAELAQIRPSTGTLGAAAQALRPSHRGTDAYFRVWANDTAAGAVLAQFGKKLGVQKRSSSTTMKRTAEIWPTVTSCTSRKTADSCSVTTTSRQASKNSKRC